MTDFGMAPYDDVYPEAGLDSSDSFDSYRGDENGPPWPKLDPLALHGIAGEIVDALDPHTEADPVAVLIEVLTAAGNAIGPAPHALAEASQHPPRLFAVTVGASARGRKGSARAQRQRLMEHADERWCKTVPMSGFGSGEALVAELADPERGDVRVFIEEGEFAKVLAVCERDGSTLSGTIRDAWDGVPLRRRVAKERVVVNAHHLGVSAHITLDELRRTLTNTQAANGFANRFLWVCARRSKLLPDGQPLDDAIAAALGQALGKRIAQARKVGRVARSASAQERWRALYEHIAEHEPPGLVGAITARAEAQLLRLSVLYALLGGSKVIDVEHLDAAWSLWCYCEQSAFHIWGDATGDDEVDRLVAAVLAARHDGLDGTQLADVFKRNARVPAIRARAERLGRVVTISVDDTGGRPRRVTYHRDFAPRLSQDESNESDE